MPLQTANYGWPLPQKEGIQQTEIEKAANTLVAVDGKAKQLSDQLAALNAAYAAHTHAFEQVTNRPTTLGGYGIADAYTKTEADQKIAAEIETAINALVNGAPVAVDTIKELATALGNDPNFATTITNLIATKLAKSANLSDVADAQLACANLKAPHLPNWDIVENGNNVEFRKDGVTLMRLTAAGVLYTANTIVINQPF